MRACRPSIKHCTLSRHGTEWVHACVPEGGPTGGSHKLSVAPLGTELDAATAFGPVILFVFSVFFSCVWRRICTSGVVFGFSAAQITRLWSFWQTRECWLPWCRECIFRHHADWQLGSRSGDFPTLLLVVFAWLLSAAAFVMDISGCAMELIKWMLLKMTSEGHWAPLY